MIFESHFDFLSALKTDSFAMIGVCLMDSFLMGSSCWVSTLVTRLEYSGGKELRRMQVMQVATCILLNSLPPEYSSLVTSVKTQQKYL
jgi:hypothetical protein